MSSLRGWRPPPRLPPQPARLGAERRILVMERSKSSLNEIAAFGGIFIAVILAFTGCGEPNFGNSQAGQLLVPRRPRTPPTLDVLAINEVDLENEEPVIGVSVGGRHRAYVVEAVNGSWEELLAAGDEPTGQVVNDLLGGVPITVTYCARNGRCRVFRGESSQPLRLAVQDNTDGEMTLRWNGQTFEQTDPQLPLQNHPFELTTWKDWTTAHPDTDVYLGPLEEG